MKENKHIPTIPSIDQVRMNVLAKMQEEEDAKNKKSQELDQASAFSKMSEMEKHKHVLGKKASGQEFDPEEKTFWEQEIEESRKESRNIH